jgi:putative membrane protein
MKKTITFICGISVTLLLGGAVRAADTTGSEQLSSQDKEFAEHVLADGKSDVQLADIASEKASNTELKDLGSQVSQHETQANDELKQMLDKKGISTEMTSATSTMKSAGQSLEGVTGVNMDKDCVQGMIKNKKKNIDECKKEVAEGQDPELKAWAAKELPIQEEHLKSAQAVEMTLEK